jgi:hypothetical protein
MGRHQVGTIFDGHPSGLHVDSFYVSRTDTVRLDVHGGPMHTTPAGNRPIVVAWVEFHHSLSDDRTTVEWTYVTVGGKPELGAKWAAGRRYPNGGMRRRFKLDRYSPDWIWQLARQSMSVGVLLPSAA